MFLFLQLSSSRRLIFFHKKFTQAVSLNFRSLDQDGIHTGGKNLVARIPLYSKLHLFAMHFSLLGTNQYLQEMKMSHFFCSSLLLLLLPALLSGSGHTFLISVTTHGQLHIALESAWNTLYFTFCLANFFLSFMSLDMNEANSGFYTTPS